MPHVKARPLVVGQRYSREEVAHHLGGGHDMSLPHKNGRVVGGCFDPEVNPEAPSIVLVGNGPGIRAAGRQFASQTQYVPVFIKRGNKQFEYVGKYRASRFDDSAKTLNEQNQRMGRIDITRVLYLESETVNPGLVPEPERLGHPRGQLGSRKQLSQSMLYIGNWS